MDKKSNKQQTLKDIIFQMKTHFQMQMTIIIFYPIFPSSPKPQQLEMCVHVIAFFNIGSHWLGSWMSNITDLFSMKFPLNSIDFLFFSSEQFRF